MNMLSTASYFRTMPTHMMEKLAGPFNQAFMQLSEWRGGAAVYHVKAALL